MTIRRYWPLGILALAFAPYLLPLPRRGRDPLELAGPQSRFVQLDGLRIHLLDPGPTDAPALLLLHGTGGSAASWYRNIPAFTAAGWRVIACDRPGSGLSDKPAQLDYSHAAQADFCARLLDLLGIAQAAVLGHSAGGNVAVHLALRHQQRVRCLIIADGLIAIPGGPPRFVGRLITQPPLRRWFRFGLQLLASPQNLARLFASGFANSGAFDPQHSAGFQQTFQSINWDLALLGLVRDSAENTLRDAQLAQLAVPTLLLWGEQDRWVSMEIGRRLVAAVPAAQWISYPAAGHFVHEECDTVFNQDVLAFLQQH